MTAGKLSSTAHIWVNNDGALTNAMNISPKGIVTKPNQPYFIAGNAPDPGWQSTAAAACVENQYNAVLVEAIKELKTANDKQQAQIEDMRRQISEGNGPLEKRRKPVTL